MFGAQETLLPSHLHLDLKVVFQDDRAFLHYDDTAVGGVAPVYAYEITDLKLRVKTYQMSEAQFRAFNNEWKRRPMTIDFDQINLVTHQLGTLKSYFEIANVWASTPDKPKTMYFALQTLARTLGRPSLQQIKFERHHLKKLEIFRNGTLARTIDLSAASRGPNIHAYASFMRSLGFNSKFSDYVPGITYDAWRNRFFILPCDFLACLCSNSELHTAGGLDVQLALTFEQNVGENLTLFAFAVSKRCLIIDHLGRMEVRSATEDATPV